MRRQKVAIKRKQSDTKYRKFSNIMYKNKM